MTNLNLLNSEELFDVWALLRLTRRAITKVRAKELSEYGLSPRRSTVLLIIKALGDNATPPNISRWLFQELHTVSELLNRMERDGLLKKVKDLHKKNLVRIVLTEKGHEAYRQASKRESTRKIFASLSSEQHRQLESCLYILLKTTLEELGMESESVINQWKIK